MKNEFQNYLESSKYVDYENALVRKQADLLKSHSETEEGLVRDTYYFVRDKISHSWDVQDRRVTVSASDVLKEGVGICWAKANLLAALLRANGVPAGFSYQRLTLLDTPDAGYCIHALNTVYLSSLHKWIRLDARGNTEKIQAAYSTEEEKLAFQIRPQYGEYDYRDNHAYPSEKLMKVLEQNSDAIYMYQNLLPDTLELA
ncbi:MAG: transglutaminase family protein [Eubacterium sp.]|nr:transglutaminase family protein [Eubacterium sp.]